MFPTQRSDGTQAASFYNMFPSVEHQYKGIVQLLLYFQWKWIGVVVPESETGQRFIETLTPKLSQHDICTAYIKMVPIENSFHLTLEREEELWKVIFVLNNTKARVCLMYADTQFVGIFTSFLIIEAVHVGKVWIMTSHWDSTSQIITQAESRKIFHGSLSFAIHYPEMPEFQRNLQRLHSDWKKEQLFIPEEVFNCSLPNFKEVVRGIKLTLLQAQEPFKDSYWITQNEKMSTGRYSHLAHRNPCKAHIVICNMGDHLQYPPEHYQKGDLLIGGIASQRVMAIDIGDFSLPPRIRWMELPE
ncbi:hypothetical protein lerEdw1_014685 [Lerista edwardsae]|nr:hypothetical protein lerEdw1_014685 [Lerista edwardsae]